MENSTKDKRITNNYTMIDTNETLAQKEWSIQNASMTTIEDIVRVPLMRGSYTAERIIRDIDFDDFLLTDRNNARRFSIRIENSDQDETLLIY